MLENLTELLLPALLLLAGAAGIAKKPLSRSMVTAVIIKISVGISESISRSPSCAPVSIPP